MVMYCNLKLHQYANCEVIYTYTQISIELISWYMTGIS